MTASVIFDLDGTLWDASESTAKAWSEVFEKYGLPVPVSGDQIRDVAGKPYLECLRIVCPDAPGIPNFDQLLSDLSQAEKKWMERIGGEFYPGALDAVREVGRCYPVFLVSNCNDWYLEAFLNHSGLRDVFSSAICHGGTGLPKVDNIRLILERFNIGKGFYLGDTRGDMEACLAAGISYVHYASGFGGPQMSNSWFVLNNYAELPELLSQIAADS